jgi:hypothetical protein
MIVPMTETNSEPRQPKRFGDEDDRAKEIFENGGAEDICTSSMSKAPAEATA